MHAHGRTFMIKLTDKWPDKVTLEVGRIGIAFAQVTREVYLAAKRKAGVGLPEWETANPSDNLTKWCQHIRKHYPGDGGLIELVRRVERAAEDRHDIFHAIWGRSPKGRLS